MKKLRKHKWLSPMIDGWWGYKERMRGSSYERIGNRESKGGQQGEADKVMDHLKNIRETIQ